MKESTEELERIKLEHEIRLFQTKFYLRPQFLSMICLSIFSAIAIFISIRMANSERLEDLKVDKRALDNQIYEINNQKLVKQKVDLEASISALERKEKNLKNTVTVKYKKKLLNLEKKLQNIRDFHVRDFALSYSNSTVKSSRVRKKIQSFVPKDRAREFEKWLYSEIKRGIDASTQGTLDKVDFELQLQEIQSP